MHFIPLRTIVVLRYYILVAYLQQVGYVEIQDLFENGELVTIGDPACRASWRRVTAQSGAS